MLRELRSHYRSGLPFVVYRKPGGQGVRAVLQLDQRLEAPRSWGEPGFVLAPYAAGRHPLVFLQPDKLLHGFPAPESAAPPPGELPGDDTQREAHISRVGEALAAIQEGALEKVVLARALDVPLQAEPFRVFENLIAYYPGAFGYLWYHPATGMWMGATPELLLSYSGETARTVSLAGTLPAVDGQPPAWGGKEIHEQQVVTDYICSRIRQQGLEPLSGSAEAVQAGSLWHLKTPITIAAQPGQVGALLRALHPTPAVCGFPLEEAKAFIATHEAFDREYYTGFLGESGLEQEGDFEFFVNLRCMKVRGTEATLYVGGGITGASDPGREWEETRQKTGTVWAAIKNSG